MNEVIFNFGLLFETSFSQELVSYSQKLKQVQPAFYSLGEQSIPHVTLLQFRDDRANAAQIWEQIRHLSRQEISVDVLGLALERWNHWDTLWLRVKRKKDLEALQADVAGILGRSDYVNGVGAKFEPHATLLAWPESHSVPPFPIQAELLNREGIKAYVTLGVSGPQFQYAECLYHS